MPLTIYQDSIGNKYIGYAGDVANVASGIEINDNIINLMSSFPGNTTQSASGVVHAWRTDGVTVSGVFGPKIGNAFFAVKTNGNNFSYQVNSKDAGLNDLYISGSVYGKSLNSYSRGVACSNGTDLAFFGWDIDGSNTVSDHLFIWVGRTIGNGNISSPQDRSGILVTSAPPTHDSKGVKQPDASTERIHLDTQAGANHLIDCGTDTGRLYLIEDDGAGGDGGAVGYCENLYLSKKAGLTIGGFVSIDGITDGGSEQGIVVGQWGDNAHLIMRVYDGIS